MPVHVEELQPRGLQTLNDHRDKAHQDVVAQIVVLLALAAFGGGVAVAEDQKVELVGGIAGALQRDQIAGRRRPRVFSS